MYTRSNFWFRTITQLTFPSVPKSKNRGYKNTVLGRRNQVINNHGCHNGGRRCVYNTSFSNETFATASFKQGESI